MAIIAVFNPRPQSGRTTLAANLLAAIGGRGRRPWGVDLDPAADLSTRFDVTPSGADESIDALFSRSAPLAHVAQITRSGVVLCPAHPQLAHRAAAIGKGLDALTLLRHALRQPGSVTGPVVIDCAAGVDTLSLNAVFACDLVLVPIACDELDGGGAAETVRVLSAFEPVFRHRIPRRYVVTRCEDERSGIEASRRLEAMTGARELCTTRVRFDPAHAVPWASAEPGRDAQASAPDYERLLDEIEAATALHMRDDRR